MDKNLKREIEFFLDSEDTAYLAERLKRSTSDVDYLVALRQAKKIFAQNLSETEQLINRIKNEI